MLISAESMAREQMKRNWMTPPVLAQGAKSIGDVRALTEPDAASAGAMPQLFFARFGASMATLNEERTLPYPFNHCYFVLLKLEIELRENYTVAPRLRGRIRTLVRMGDVLSSSPPSLGEAPSCMGNPVS